MNDRYHEALNFLREARELNDLCLLEGRFLGMVSSFGFDRTACVMMAEPGRPINPRVLFGVGNIHYRARYLGHESYRTDPTFQAVFHKTRAFTWSDIERTATSDEAKALFASARQDGSEGLVVPVHGTFGEVSAVVMVGTQTDTCEQSKAVLQACGCMFAVAGLQLMELEDDALTSTELSRRETQVLIWLSRGKTVPEIAAILNVSIGTTKTHLERAKLKLGAHGTVPTVLEAARRGWLIDPDDFH